MDAIGPNHLDLIDPGIDTSQVSTLSNTPAIDAVALSLLAECPFRDSGNPCDPRKSPRGND